MATHNATEEHLGVSTATGTSLQLRMLLPCEVPGFGLQFPLKLMEYSSAQNHLDPNMTHSFFT